MNNFDKPDRYLTNTLFKYFLVDRKYQLARNWSNRELKKFAHFFKGDIIDVSAWQDRDKQGFCYRDYFVTADNYYISNYKKEAKGLQGYKNEFFLDLENALNENLVNRFDVVFNHTTLEHVYNFKLAFRSLCLLTKDIVILVVPFVQQMHAEYGDYWRFTPLAMKKMFEENNMAVLYSSFSNYRKASVYLFFIASKKPEKWTSRIFNDFDYKCKKDFLDVFEDHAGCRAIKNSWLFRIISSLRIMLSKIKEYFKSKK